jgi:two-component system chemotaxis response regulator CheB
MSVPEQVIAIGASAGGIQAVRTILQSIPEGFPAAILIVVHTSAEGPGLLPTILQRNSPIEVVPALEGIPIQRGMAYVAVPGKHLIVENGRTQSTRGPFENRNRPAIDPMFRSVAKAYGRGAIGVVLSGYLDDGTAGLLAIKRHGGRTAVQDPDDAEVPSMPMKALASVNVDIVASAERLPSLLISMVREGIPEPIPPEKEEKMEEKSFPSVYTCPECHGTLWEVQNGKILRFECRVGHAYSQESMVEDQNESTERALWAALRALEESAQLSRRLVKRSEEMRQNLAVERFQARAKQAEAHIRALRRILGHVEPQMGSPENESRPSLV